MYESVLADLAAEHADLDRIVAALDVAAWDAPTPAEGWAVRDQISHLAYFDERAHEALTDPAAFNQGLEAALARGTSAVMAEHLAAGRAMDPGALLGWWRGARAELLAAMAEADPSARVPWYGPPMSAVSFATARLMETWAHGQDVVDAVGAARPPTARLKHVAHIGVRAMPFSYTVRGLPVPTEPIFVELSGPDGDAWSWGPADAPNRVTGPALDFCLVATQRRHRDDTALVIAGPIAEEWMSIAQAFAGEPGPGRQPGQFDPGVDPRAEPRLDPR